MNHKNLLGVAAAIVMGLQGLAGVAHADAIKKAPYAIERKSEYRQDFLIEMREFSGETDPTRAYLKKLVANILRDRIRIYKSIKVPRPILEFDRKTHNVDAPSKQDGERFTHLAIRFVDDPKDAKPKQRDAVYAPVGNRAPDVTIAGTVTYRGDRLSVGVTVDNRFHDAAGTVTHAGTLKEINVLIDRLAVDVMKLIIHNYGYLTVHSIPKGAGLYVDNRYFGKTDVENLVIESGDHRIEVRTEDQLEAESAVTVPTHGVISVTLELQQLLKPGDRTIRVVTNPEKASVYLDSRLVGVSPLEIKNLRAGTYRLRVAKDGHVTKFKTIKLDELKETTIDFSLEPGRDEDYYFSRTTWYMTAFKVSLIGAAVCAVSSFYLDIRMEDERAKVRGFSFKDPNNPTPEERNSYDDLKRRADERIDTYRLYQTYSIYAAVTFLVSAGVFYLLDVRQYDIDIAFYWDPGLPRPEDARRPAVQAQSIGFRSAGVALTYFF
ncbi:MAG TPA: PEGA domain-containing protein [Spirochaetota bacterium]|nr:PEGA domain-containing protein [Spirochaetota bacterium]HNT11940.1 PEGA domain-containing protein [Spirochaetota bacterium]